MSPLVLGTRELARVERLTPYARRMLELAGGHALRLHARAVCPEHLLWQLMRDEDGAAHRAVVHAFADPDSIAAEVLALSEGLLVVGSGVSLPFSVRAVRALFAARALADADGAAEVAPGQLLEAACGELPAELGLVPATLRRLDAPIRIDPGAGDGLFRGYGQPARRVLGSSCKLAHRLGRTSIAPAHLVLSALEIEPALTERFGIGALRARAALAGHDDDPTEPVERAIGLDPSFDALFDGMARDADTLELLAAYLARGGAEVQALLKRQRVTPAMVERSRALYQDP
ncbi:MAG: hypothetical protein FJ299_01835 [Planctomycetes bacterium]|nr:hypothetical protein [Planctomycetota bacterium]